MRLCRYIFSEMDIDGGDTPPVSENASTYQEHGMYIHNQAGNTSHFLSLPFPTALGSSYSSSYLYRYSRYQWALYSDRQRLHQSRGSTTKGKLM
jgi:hypothetical protein